MTTFLNIEIDKPIYWKFLLRHILFLIIWGTGMGIFIFRIDLNIIEYFSDNENNLIEQILPIAFIVFVFVVMFFSKWYYNFALVFYPLLLVFWFFPKFILSNGKIYLFSNYLSGVFNFFKNIKKSIIHVLLFAITVFILLISNSIVVKSLSLIIFSYFYFRFVYNYLKHSFSPPKLFGTDIEAFIEEMIQSPEKGMAFIKSIDKQSVNDKLSEEVVKMKKIERLIMVNYFIGAFKDHLNGFNGKKAFVISWIYQLVGFLIVTISYFTFANFELFKISAANFTTIGNPNVFEFFYYTFKTITFSDINSIIPNSIITKSFEIMSFLTLGVFLLIIVTSIIFSLRQDRIGENIKKATDLCITQNKLIAEHVKIAYQTDIQTVLQESINIRTSVENMRRIVGRFF